MKPTGTPYGHRCTTQTETQPQLDLSLCSFYSRKSKTRPNSSRTVLKKTKQRMESTSRI
ncbi:hypothetical protein HanRHA438_Chr08g0345201 [Helianthus annuus]|nr:hypothetical protein HanIR_Chr08g0360541 [Helianthus annuus]KAJ0897390.1 hypothetical protein HanRHA438_Chr08g0345201 [Helianthus annuus]